MAVSESPVNVSRKLVDLRVVDLKLELEKRSLEKTGVKAALIDRLKKALEEEGISNPDEYEFEANDSPVLKKQVPATPVGKKSPRIKEKDKEGEEEEESCEMEEALLEVAAEAVEEGDGSEEEVDLDLDKFMEVDEVKGDEDQAEMKILEDGGEDNLVNDDTIQLSLDEEEKLLDEEEKQLEEKEKATDKKEAEAPSESKQMDSQTTPTKPAEDAGKDMENNKSTGDGSAGSKNVSAPPTPTSVPVVAPLTSDDTLKMDTSGERKDDDLSLIVHVDDTQNDLDSDILGEGLKKEGSVEPKQESTSESDKTQEVKDGGGDASATKVKPAGGEADSSGGAKTTESTPAKAGKEVKAEAGSGAKKETKAGEKKEDDPKKDGDKSKSGAPTKDVKPGEKDVKGSTTKLASSSRNLWVSGLSTSTRATDLKTLFSKHGKVAGAKVVTNARSPGSRCYGYVTMSTAEEASKCIQHLHRTELHGRMISVEKAKGDPAAQAKKLDPKAVAAAAKKVGEAKKDEKDKKPDGKKGDEKKEGDKKDDKKVEKKSPHSSSARRHSSGSGRPRPGSRSGYGHWRDRGHSYHGRPYPPPRIHQSRSPRDRSRTSSHGAHSPGHAHAKTKEPAKDEKETKEGAAETDEKAKDAASSATATPKAETGEKTEETNKDKKVDKKEDILSFEKIKEERERERLKQRERQLREEERRRLGDLERQRQRQREIERRQREEAVRLEREKERLRAERMKLERDRIEAERLERERIRLERERRERERVEREREEAQRRAEQIRFEEQRRAQKRSYESRGPPRDDYYEPKRPTMESRYSDFDHRGRGGYEDRGQTSNGFERRVERYDRRDGRSLESTSRHEPPRRYEDRGPVRDSDTRDRRDQGSSRDRHEMHDRRDHHDRVSHSDRSRVSSHDRMGGPSPRVVSPARRSGDSRSEWKSDRGSMPGPDRRETTRDRAYQDSGISKGNPSSSREWSSGGSDRGSSKAGGSWNQVGQSQSSVGRPSDRWPSSVSSPVDRNGIRPQHSSAAGGMVMNPPMMQGPAAGNAFLASAANIMMGVGLAGSRPQEQRYDAYKNLSSGGGMRRY